MTGNVTVSSTLEVTRTSGKYIINTDPTGRLVSNGDYYGELLAIGGTGSPTAGNVYYYNSAASWSPTNAGTGNASVGLLAIATTGAGFDRGMLIRGYYLNTSWSFTAGSVLYLAVSSGGITQTQPTGGNNIVRIVGFAISATEIYFNPSNDWIQLV